MRAGETAAIVPAAPRRASIRRLRLRLLLAAALGIPACAYLSLRPEAAPRLGALQSRELVEISGLAESLAAPGTLWALNDSGDRARLFRVGPLGEDLGQVNAVDPTSRTPIGNDDWEDLAAFDWQGTPALLVADVGDNMAWRDRVTLYALRDPGTAGTQAELLWKLHLRYPDGARDCEGVAVDPLTGDILLLSKRDRPPRLYRVAQPAAPPAPDAEPVTAEYVGEVLHVPRPGAADLLEDPLYGLLRDWTTAFAISPDGRFAVVTTYKDAYRYARAPGQPWAEVFARQPERVDLPQFKQTEAAAISADGRTLTVASEKFGGFAVVALP